MASLFSGRAGRLAAMAQAQAAANAQRAIDERLTQGRSDALAAIDAGQPLALDALRSGYERARGAYGDASARFAPYAQTGLSAWNMLADATGLSGQAGYDRATSAFRASPGYQWQVDQATDAVARKANAMGLLGSGNAMTAIQDRASHLADQEYGGWLSRLSGMGDRGFAATTAQAGLDRGIGDLWAQQGAGEASIYDTNAARRAGIHTGLTGMAVNALGNTWNQIGQASAAGHLAGQNAAANRMNFGMNLANLGLNLAGRLFGGTF